MSVLSPQSSPKDDGRAMRRREIITVRDLVSEYLARTESMQGVDTFTERKAKLLMFVADKGSQHIEGLIPDDLEGWVELHQEWKSDWTRLRVANTIKRPFNWATKKGLIGRNPFAMVSYPEGPRGRPMDRRDFLRMLRATDDEFRRVLLFMSISGARPCELANLEWSFIDTTNGTATLYVHKTARSRKDRAPRVIYLSDLAIRLLIWIRRRRPMDKLVFLNSRGQPWCRNSLDLRIWRLREKLGIPKTAKLYGIRHAWATNLAIAGVNLAELASLLGHTTVEMAKYYVHLAGETVYLRAELERGLKGIRRS